MFERHWTDTVLVSGFVLIIIAAIIVGMELQELRLENASLKAQVAEQAQLLEHADLTSEAGDD